MTWNDWASLHANLSAMTSLRDMDMLSDWCVLFKAEGFIPDELADASRWISVNDPPSFRSDHIRRLTERVRSRRRECQEQSRPNDEDPRGVCSLCHGCGMVSVPGAGMTTIGKNKIPDDSTSTVAVLCSCALGNWMGRQQSDKPMMSLAAYTQIKPNWRDEEKRIEILQQMRSQAHEEATKVDMGSNYTTAFDIALNKIRKRVEANRRGESP